MIRKKISEIKRALVNDPALCAVILFGVAVVYLFIIVALQHQ